MTDELAKRNAEICTQYIDGTPVKDIAKQFQLTRSRIYDILEDHDVPKRGMLKTTTRDAFLGVKIDEEIKEAIRQKAEASGLNMSELTNEVFRKMLKEVL